MTKNLNDMESEETYYVSKDVSRQLLKAKEICKIADQDRIYIVTGMEGSGKSTLAFQLAYHLDKDFTLDDIVFNAQDFEDRIRNKKRYGCICFDECFNGLSRRSALSGENKKLLRLLQECRQRNLIVFLVLPSVFLLESYVVFHRANSLFHTSLYKKDYRKRYFKVFNKKNLKLLFQLGRQTMSYSKPKIFHKHRFYGKMPSSINEKAYRQKKLDSFRDVEKKKTSEELKYKLQRDILITKVHEQCKIKYVDIAKWFEAYDVELNSRYIAQIPRKLEKSSHSPHPIL